MRQEQSRSKTPAARILSLALALCMIAAFVPAFTLTVGAVTIDTSLPEDATLVFNGGHYGTDAIDSSTSYYDTVTDDAGTPWSVFSTTTTGSYKVNLRDYTAGNDLTDVYLQYYYNGSTTNVTGNASSYVTVLTDEDNAFAKNTEYFALQFFFNRAASNNILDFGLIDADGNPFSGFEFHYESNCWFFVRDRIVEYLGTPTPTLVSGSTQTSSQQLNAYWITIFVRNDLDANTYTVTYGYNTTQNVDYSNDDNTTSWTELATLQYDGYVNGFSGLKTVFTKSGNYQNVRLGGLRIYSGPEIESSSATSVIQALDAINTLPIRADETTGSFEIEDWTVTDSYNNTFNITNWESSDTNVISISGTTATVTPTDEVTYVTLTPTAQFDDETTVTGSAHTIVVFPASRADTTYNSGSGYYEIDETNIVENGSFEDENGFTTSDWTSHSVANSYAFQTAWWVVTEDGVYAAYDDTLSPANTLTTADYAIPDGDYALGSMWGDAITQDSNYCTIDTFWEVTEAGTYYFSFYGKNVDGCNTNDPQIFAYFTATETHNTGTPSYTSGYEIELSDDWYKYEYIITADSAGYICFTASSLRGSNWPTYYLGSIFDDFELYEATKQEEYLVSADTVTAAVISGTEPVLPSTVTGEGSLGSTLTESVTWNEFTEDQFVNDTTAATTAYVYGTTDTSNVSVTANVTVYPLTYTLSDITCPTSTSGVGAYAELLQAAEGQLVIEFEYTPTAVANNWIYISNGQNLWGDGAIGFGTDNDTTGHFNTKSSSTYLGYVSAGTTYHMLVETTVSDHTYTLTMASDGDNIWTNTDSYRTASDSLDTIVVSTNGAAASFTLTNIKVYDPNCVLVDYTVEYVNTEGNKLDEDGTYSTTEANTLGYAGEVICSDVTIPYFTGYIFTSKSVDTSDNTITLTYTATSDVDKASVGYDVESGITNFFYNVADDTQFVSLNMLGSHDAFALQAKNDAAAIARGESGASSAASYSNAVIAQSLDVLGQLEAGARYFDIRLTRSDSDTITDSSYTTNGVFYTTHNSLSEEFKPILVTLYQWMEEHPGEVVSIYFQEIWDGTADGNTSSSDLYGSTTATWTDLNALLEETGINDFAPYSYNEGTSMKNITYSGLTESGTKAGVVMFARATGYTCGNFYYGSTSDTYSWKGKLYSYYDSDNVPTGSTLDTSYIQTQVDTLADYNESDDPSDDHPVYHMARVMQAQNELTSTQLLFKTATLLSIAESTNSQLYTALTSEDYSEWLTALPIVMVNAVGTNTEDIVKLLQNCNEAHDITITYVDESGTELATKTKSVLVGSLYTDETIYTIVDNSYDATDGNSVIYSLETLTTKPSTSYGSAVVFTPAYGLTSSSTTISDTIEIVAAKLTDTVYTVRSGILYSSASGVGSDSSNPAFSAYTWGSSLTSPDRIGIAIVDVPSDFNEKTQTYELTATQLRSYSTGSLNTYFYIIPIDTYNSTDVSDNSAIAALFDDSYIATYSKTYDNNDTTSAKVSYTLDADDISVYAGQTVVIIGTSTVGLYGLSSDIAIEAVDKDYGVTLYAGAQIRVGDGMGTDPENTEEYQQLLGDSGLRFIAVVDKTETMATNATEIGIAIFDGKFSTTAIDAETAKSNFENTTPVTTITDDVYQDEEAGVFTAAIVNIDEDNYNRIYVAVPYVIVDGTTYYNWDATVARTPYQVAKGILVDSDATSGYTQLDGDGNEVAGTDALINVLNVYTNKTGARITVASSEDGYTIVAADYANGATEFFTVSEDSTLLTSADGTGTIILVPMNDSVKFYDYAEDYYRVNNAHDAFIDAKGATAEIDGNGYLVITIPAATE